VEGLNAQERARAPRPYGGTQTPGGGRLAAPGRPARRGHHPHLASPIKGEGWIDSPRWQWSLLARAPRPYAEPQTPNRERPPGGEKTGGTISLSRSPQKSGL